MAPRRRDRPVAWVKRRRPRLAGCRLCAKAVFAAREGAHYTTAMHVEILLVRHGQSEGNRDRRFTGHGPSRLTELGRAQAEATARAIAAQSVDVLYSSDLARCLETAAPLARVTGLVPVEDC